jgi:DNA polymerase III alpha subunit
LNNNEGMYPKWVLVEEAKRCGLEVRPPCVNRSDLEFSMENGAIRTGIGYVGSVTWGTVERLLEKRPFASLEDLVARARPRQGEVELLIRCGALDFSGLPRNHLLWKVMTGYQGMRERKVFEDRLGLGLESAPAPEGDVPELPRLSESSMWRDEWEIMGFTSRTHPMVGLRSVLRKAGVAPSSAIPRRVRRPIRLAGVIAATRKTRTERGQLMQFLTLDDEQGVFEVVLFPDVYHKTRFLLDGPGPYLVEGRVEDQYGALTVNASRLEAVVAG